MAKIHQLRHEFVESFPEPMVPGVLYVSMRFASAGHLCCCGCGKEVVTPLSPTDWKVIFDGETVTLHPSVGNWKLPCRSHYIISRGVVEWATSWSPARVDAADQHDKDRKSAYYARRAQQAPSDITPAVPTPPTEEPELSTSLWLRLRRLWK